MNVQLSCQYKDCMYNSEGVCQRASPKINLWADGTFGCESREDMPKSVQLTKKEADYLRTLLGRRRSKLYSRMYFYDPDEVSFIDRINIKLTELFG